MLNNYREIYHVEDLPVFQNRMFLSEEAAQNCLKGNLVLVQDIETGLIFNKEFQSQLMQYDECYQNEQAVSSIFKDHLLGVSMIIARHFRNMSLIELGCGKGYFLEQMQDQGFDITEFDPAYEGKNPKIIKKYFDPDIGMNAEGIILRHVLEHVQNPVQFMMDICQSNGGKGKIYIEVPCFDWICRKRAWFDIFYEHVNYFRMSDFNRMFDKIFDMGHVFGGQYLYVIAELSTIKKPVYTNSDRIEFPKNFLDTIYGYANRIRSQVSGLKNHSAIWGGASKGVIFGLFMKRAGADIDIVIDINPAKQGKYLPATGYQVVSPTDALKRLAPRSDIFVMNSNYLSEIKEMTNNQFNYLSVDNDNI